MFPTRWASDSEATMGVQERADHMDCMHRWDLVQVSCPEVRRKGR